MSVDRDYQLEHRYTRAAGRVYLTGVQALVRLPMEQRRRDRAAGLRTAGFISGYRGSPLGTYDMGLWQARPLLEAHDVTFAPGVNEDLAATAVWGTQQATLHADAKVDGVFGIWYGKGPGVDRSCDALKHANYAGTAKHGGVLALCGDDPAARSSSIAHQSEHAFVHCAIPVLNPSSVQEYLDFGLFGFALSRFAGSWVAMKCLTDTVDSARSVDVGPDRVRIVPPSDFELPPGGLSIRWANLPLEVERRVHQQRLPAALAFARANGIDRDVFGASAGHRRLGIVTAGKTYLDVRQALEELGIDERRAFEIGLCLYKVGMVWPVEPEGLRRFCSGLEDVLVIEEKRALIEDQLARLLYNQGDRPRLLGKQDERGAPLVPAEGELAPGAIAELLRGWLECRVPELASTLPPRPEPIAAAVASGLMRLPSFCSGCPHNRSTVLPEGSFALGGIGCHGMAVWLPERRTLAVTQMGGEGANWIGQAPYVETPHIFQNVGDGTYFHSALLAIRAAVAAKVNITYKVLVNGAVAMTGGQPIEGEPALQGEVTVPEVVRQLDAEGVRRIAVVSDDPAKFGEGGRFPAGVTVHHRDDLDRVQKDLRTVTGVSALVYDQSCAAEARRLRKDGTLPTPDPRVVINEAVCEGCGDCSVQSNCISIEPIETAFGRKRRINQSSCNKDYSCLHGYCPSFVTVIGGKLRKTGGAATPADEALFAALPEPAVAPLDRPWNVLVTGIGGGGVITVGALIGMAAHLEGKGASALDVTGLAQKNGPVTSHVRIAARPEELFATRITAGGSDLVLGSDIVVTAGADTLMRMGEGSTHAVVNRHVAPTSDFATRPDLDLSPTDMENAIAAVVGAENAHFLDATELATALLGDAIGTNLFLVGHALQRGWLPVSRAALEHAIELNGRAIAMNKRALAWGRLAAHDLAAVQRAARPGLRDEAPLAETSLDALVEHRAAQLTAYQSAAYAQRYRDLVARVATQERARCGPGDAPLARAVARYAAKLMAYKDEYEVARLYIDGTFQAQIAREFESWDRLEIQLAPQIANPRDPDTGRAKKRSLGPWMFPVLRGMARLKFLRGTPFDPFGWTAHRKIERRLVTEYVATLDEVLAGLTPENRSLAIEIACMPEGVRGFDLVKEKQLADAQAKQREALALFRTTLRG